MHRLAIEIANIDEDMAEKAFHKMVESLSLITELDKKSVQVEPHDDVRGVWASVDLLDPEFPSQVWRQSMVAATKSLLNAILYNVTKATIHVMIEPIKLEGE